MSGLQELFDEHAGIALSKQRDLGLKLGEHQWDLDLDTGRATFGKKGFLGFGSKRLASAIQVLGSESQLTDTWLWSWANEQLPAPPALLRVAEELRALGEQRDIAELVTAQLAMTRADGHKLAMIASGITGVPGYYRGPYDRGAVFFLLEDESLRTPVPRPTLRFSTVMPELIQHFEIHDHALAATGLARGLGLDTARTAEALRITGSDGTVRLTFDSLGRMASLEGELG